jgi:hypothetical protein
MTRDEITTTSDELTRYAFELAQAGRDATIDMGGGVARLKVGSRVFVAPIAIPAQREPGGES